MSCPWRVIGLPVLLVAAAWVQASPQSGSTMSTIDASAVDCAQLAAASDSAISVEACKSLFEMTRVGDAEAARPEAQRPGDEAMSCEQIFAEMGVVSGDFAATPEDAQTQASLDEYLAMKKRQDAEIAAAAAVGNAKLMGAAAVDMATGGLSKGAVTSSAATALNTEAMARAARFKAEARPVVGRMNQAIDASAQYGAQQLQANPRAAQLGQLAIRKNCRAPGA